MLFKKLKSILITTSLIFVFTAHAQENQKSVVHTPNVYLVAGIGWGVLKDAEYHHPGAFFPIDTKKRDDIGAIAPLVGLGYQFNPYIALEFNYVYFDGASGTVTDIAGTRYKEDSYAHSFATLATLKYPFAEKFAVFAKLGPSYNIIVKDKKREDGAEFNEGGNEWDVAYGGGLEYNFSHRFGTQVQYLATGSETWIAAAGLIVKF